MTNNSQTSAADQYQSQEVNNDQRYAELLIKFGVAISAAIAILTMAVTSATYFRLASKDFLREQEQEAILKMKIDADDQLQKERREAETKILKKANKLMLGNGRIIYSLKTQIKEAEEERRCFQNKLGDLLNKRDLQKSEAESWVDKEKTQLPKRIIKLQAMHDAKLKIINDDHNAFKAQINKNKNP